MNTQEYPLRARYLDKQSSFIWFMLAIIAVFTYYYFCGWTGVYVWAGTAAGSVICSRVTDSRTVQLDPATPKRSIR